MTRAEDKEYFLYLEEKQKGPFSFDEVQLMLQSKEISFSDFVFYDGMNDWTVLSECFDFVQPQIEKRTSTLKQQANTRTKETSSRNLVECPDCGSRISMKAKSCPQCGHPFEENSNSDNEQLRTDKSKINNGVAAVLSFLVPGLGQLYRGKIFIGIVWFFWICLSYWIFILAGLCFHLICIYGAYNSSAEKK